MVVSNPFKGLLFAGGFALLLTSSAWAIEVLGSGFDEVGSVHQQMAEILNEEVPADVTRIVFDAAGSQQECFLSDGHREANANVSSPSHVAPIVGQLARKGTSSWETEDPIEGRWVWTVQRGHEKRADASAIRAQDFRALVRQCVAAVRLNRHQNPAGLLTAEENRASWNLAHVAN